ncbi:MAG TPA: hypothetical protein VFJ47_00075, partial [Terriglobales bacterium]|nr:hypothetical protein [Terriglobales bacterium]
MKLIARLTLVVCLLAGTCLAGTSSPEAVNSGEELDRTASTGQYGGRLVIGQRSEPKTLNPVIATDAVSREV